MSRRRYRQLAVAALAAGASATCARQVVRRPPGGAARWSRTNYRGNDVDVLGGPPAAAGLIGACVLLAPTAPGALVSAVGGGALGLYDDLAGHTHARGLRGHAAALRSGTVTSGLVKMGGLVVTAAVAARLSGHRSSRAVVDTVLIAGTANLVNLLDLRPGRALKAAAAVSLPLLARPDDAGCAAAAVVATCAALMPDDLGERRMLGDAGANALGAVTGWALATRLSPARACLVTGGVIALTLASERVSFSRVIDAHPVLRAVDMWGRRAA